MSARERRKDRNSTFVDPSKLPTVALSVADNALFNDLDGLDEAMPKVEAAIVAKRGDVIELGKFRISAIGLKIEGEVTEAEWTAMLDAVKKIKRSLPWIVGDLIAHGETFLNKTYDEMGKMIGINPKTLREWAYVCRNVSMSIRMDGHVKFGHHQVIVALPEPSQVEWIRHAEAHKLSVAKLREELTNTPTPNKSDPMGGKHFARNARSAGGILNSMGDDGRLTKKRAKELLGYVEQMRAWMDEAERVARGNL